MQTTPTYEQAKLHLQIYEMRREPRLRQARDWFFKNYFADSLQDAMRIAPPGSENGTLTMMVASYWNQACAFLSYGLLHEDLFFETTAEFYGVWQRLKPMIPDARKLWSNNQFMAHLEAAANKYEKWLEQRSPGAVEAMRQFGKQMRERFAGEAVAV